MAYRFGAFTLDEESRELSRGAIPIPLSPRGFDLLALLARERPRAIPKEDLLKALWPDAFVTDGSLSQLVTEIRQALDDSAREPRYIRTVHRYGYAFCGEALEDVATTTGRPSDYFVLWRGQEIPLVHGQNVIGRDPQARIRLVSTKASRRHARIDVNASKAVLTDLGSRNGTYVGDQRIAEQSALADGDHIVIGDEVIVFCSSDPATTTRTGKGVARH